MICIINSNVAYFCQQNKAVTYYIYLFVLSCFFLISLWSQETGLKVER